jgi:hypothetical protein
VRWQLGDERECLFDVLRKFITLWRAQIDLDDLRGRLSVPYTHLSACLTDLAGLRPPIPFEHMEVGRLEWIERNLQRRFEILKELLNEFN